MLTKLSTITIIRVTLNTELDTMRLKSQQAQMAYSEVETLVFPISMRLREGLYVERSFLSQNSTFKANVVCFFAEK